MNPRLLVLCFGNFIIGTGTLIVPGMLPALAHGLGVNVPVAAQLITAFAFTVCVTAPPLAALTARFDRRALLVAFLLLWGIGCFSTNSAQQARLVMLSPPHAPVSVAMNSSAMYFGQAVGTAAGAALIAGLAGPSAYTALALISIPLFIVSIVVSLLAERARHSSRDSI